MKTISRREPMSAGAGLAGIAFLPANVLGREGVTPPSEKMNLAFCGIGMRGALDLQGLSDLKQNVVAVCDVDWSTSSGFCGRAAAGPSTSRTLATAAKYPTAKRYTDYRKMLEERDKNIDGVAIATLDHTRGHRAPGDEDEKARICGKEYVPHGGGGAAHDRLCEEVQGKLLRREYRKGWELPA